MPAVSSGARAAAAAASVQGRFGRRLLGLPGTHLPHVTYPRPSRLGRWQYWWLAHYLDCLVDQSVREHRCGRPEQAQYAVALAHRTLRTIRIRNGMRLRNRYVDDMAWLLLAVQRLQQVDPDPSRRRSLTAAARELSEGVLSGESSELGGGLYWNDRRDLKNVAATAPAALSCARAGDLPRARRLIEWLYTHLYDPRSGLLLDGLRRGRDGRWHLVRDRFTYNQGVVLGALVELGDPASLSRATDLVHAIDTHLTVPGEPHRLTTHGDDDGGLFTGIAARYLALAARSPSLAEGARSQAAAQVRNTALALWDGRADQPVPARSRQRRSARGMPDGPLWAFSPDPSVPADPGRPVELSTQLQAWMLLEAAATLDAP